jgi:hypothetical protein
LRRMIVFLLSSTILITACNLIPVAISSPVTSTPTQTVKPTTTPTIPAPTLTLAPKIPTLETPKTSAVPKTELHLVLKNSTGEPIPFSKAELLIDAWLLGPRQIAFPLETNGNLLVLSLDEDVARKTWIKDDSLWIRNYFIYLEADGYVPVRSKGMSFIGATQESSGELVDEVVVEFHNGPRVTIPKGETRKVELTLREPQGRYLLFVDDNHNPVSDVKVRSYMFWSNSNHCAYPQGANFLAEGVSDKEGQVAIPDGEFEYLLEFEKALYHLKDPPGWNPMRLTTYLSSQKTIIELHRLNKRPLEMIVRKDGELQANRTLYGNWTGCPCGLCPYDLAVTDDKGRISLDEFYPEEWRFVFFEDMEKTSFAWQADPKEFPATGVIEVELSE